MKMPSLGVAAFHHPKRLSIVFCNLLLSNHIHAVFSNITRTNYPPAMKPDLVVEPALLLAENLSPFSVKGERSACMVKHTWLSIALSAH
jgi:hypothetical protein